MNKWIRDNFEKLGHMIPNLEDLSYEELTQILSREDVFEMAMQEEEGEGEVPVHEFNEKKSKEMLILEQMKKELIEKYVYEDEIEKKEQMILRQIEQTENEKKN